MNAEKSRRRIRALEAVAAPGSGATKAERETARRIALRIAADNPHLAEPETVFVVGGVEFNFGG